MNRGFTAGSVVHVKGTRVQVTGPGAHRGTWVGQQLDDHGRPHGPLVDFRDTDVQDRDRVGTGDPARLEHTSGGGGGCAASEAGGGRFDQVLTDAWCQLL